MSLKNNNEFSEILEAAKYAPCISLILPFEPKMDQKAELLYKLKLAVHNIETELGHEYPDDKVQPVMAKLRGLIEGLNYYTHKKSVAIFVSPVYEKVYYLDFPVQQRVVTGDSFEVRDLIAGKKDIRNYLLAVLSSKSVKVYASEEGKMVPVMLDVPEHVAAYKHELPEKVGNFSDTSAVRENNLDNFLHHIDNGITLLLQAYQLPLFVMGNDRVLGHFKKITKNQKHIIEFVHGDHAEKNPGELRALMLPYENDWKMVAAKRIKSLMDDAMSHQRLVFGIHDVWKAASQKKAKLLIVEKQFVYPAIHGSDDAGIFPVEENVNSPFPVTDAVDDIIEKVLACGGDIEFVEEGFLDEFLKIALVEYY